MTLIEVTALVSVSDSERNPTVTGVWGYMWGALKAKAYGYALH
jgi:hypothetical protein